MQRYLKDVFEKASGNSNHWHRILQLFLDYARKHGGNSSENSQKGKNRESANNRIDRD